MEPSEVADAVRRAAAGDKVAWEALIEGFSPMIWGVAIAHRLGPNDANEVAQTTWLRLLEHFDRIEHPERVGGWLAKTARNESLRMIRLRGRELPLGAEDGAVTWGTTATPTPEAVVLTRDRDRRLWSAFVRLDQRCQTLLRLAVLDPAALRRGGVAAEHAHRQHRAHPRALSGPAAQAAQRAGRLR